LGRRDEAEATVVVPAGEGAVCSHERLPDFTARAEPDTEPE
jgi:hypothetical protein